MSKRRRQNSPVFTYKYKPLTEGQQNYFDALHDKNIRYLAISGPPGVGKTLLSLQKAACDLLEGRINKIYLCTSVTPIFGEEIGFIPGNVKEKMSTWMLPMTDHLSKFIPDYAKRGDIEYIPLAQIRGRTIDNSILILDEAQNVSLDVFKAVLTRISDDSRLYMMGDFDQSDKGKHTDFEKVCRALDGMSSFDWINLTDEDIIRSKSISEINKRLKSIQEPEPVKYY